MPAASPLHVRKISVGYWRATFDNPPINLFDSPVFAALRMLIDEVERDDHVRIVVFDSADPAYFVSHLDVDGPDDVPEVPGSARLVDDWHHFVARLARAPIVSIASIRGRARGMGAEFALACDMRFASRETGVLAVPQLGLGVVPGGGSMDWLPHLVGRPRALEIMLGGQDFDSDTAERYGWVNRALPDDKLDAFVEELATRVAGFDRRAIATTKRMINERSALPTEKGLQQSFSAFLEACTWPEAKVRLAAMRAKGWGRDTEVELHYSHHVGQLASEILHSERAPKHPDGETR